MELLAGAEEDGVGQRHLVRHTDQIVAVWVEALEHCTGEIAGEARLDRPVADRHSTPVPHDLSPEDDQVASKEVRKTQVLVALGNYGPDHHEGVVLHSLVAGWWRR